VLAARLEMLDKENPQKVSSEILFETHKTPTKNLVTISIEMFTEKLDKVDDRNVNAEQSFIAVFLPFVSAKYAQKCELITIPKYAAPFNTPLAVIEGFRTQSASMNGNTNPMLSDSTITSIKQRPHVTNNSLWKIPLPVLTIASS
jgi:hypothetical protein